MNITTFSLRSGILIVPEDLKVLSATYASDSDCAGILEVTHSDLAPHIIFSRVPLSSYDITMEELLIKECFNDCPALEDIFLSEIKPVYEGEILINSEEYIKSSHILITPVDEIYDNGIYASAPIIRRFL